MASFLISPATRNTIAVRLSYPYGLPSVSIHGFNSHHNPNPIHSNIDQSIAYKISKRRLIKYLAYWNLTHMAYCEGIELTSFKQSWDKTNVHMAHFITKCMSNTLSTVTILQRRGHVATNLWPRCVLSKEKIQHLYQYTHEGIHGRWTVSVDALRKWL